MYKINQKILQTPVSDKHILLLEPEAGLYFELNETSVIIFQGIIDGLLIDDLAQKLNDVYHITVQQARHDVETLIKDLIAHNIISLQP